MARKDLLESTEKKESKPKKKVPSKKSGEAAPLKDKAEKHLGEAAQGDARGKKTLTKSSPGAKSGAKVRKKAAGSKAKARTTAKTKRKKPAAPRKPKVSKKDLLFRKFETMAAQEPAGKVAYQPKAPLAFPEAPPFVTGYDEEETKRIRGLLFKQFDMKVKASPEVVKKPVPRKKAPAKKPKVSMKNLLFKKFDTAAAKGLIAGRVYQPKAPLAFPEAPPFVTGYDEEETKRIRGLLFKQFDIKVKPPPEAARAAAPAEVAAMPSGPEVLAAYQPPPPVVSPGAGGTSMAIKAGLGALAVLILIIIGTSFSNRGMFYLEKVDDGVQVWRGKFAPIGKELVLHLKGMEMPSPVRDVYSKEEVYPMAFSYFQGKADGLLNDPGGPDFSRIKGYLHQAASYAPTGAMRHRIQARLDGIDFVVLLHRADIALTKGTLPDLQAAMGYLDKAASYASSSYQREQLAKTRAVLEKAFAGVKGG
jgi:hypothetical protein